MIYQWWYGSGSWSPAKLTGLVGWYKADAGVYTDAGVTLATNGQTVEQWNDQSGNGNHLIQSTGGSRPTFQTNQLNGLPGIVFSGVPFMQASISLGGTTASAFCVAEGNTPGASGRLIVFQATGDLNDFTTVTSAVLLYYNPTTTIQSIRNNAVLSNGAVVNAAFSEVGSIYDGINNTIYVNGVGQTSAASSGSFGSTGALSVGTVNSGPFIGTVTEFIFTNSAVSAADRTNIHTYFTNKWGV